MNSARLLRTQPLRYNAAIRQAFLRQSRPFHNSKAMFRQKDHEHSAHTISQRLRSLKRIPPELLPLGVVIGFALFAACFAMGKKLFTDKTLRLHKSTKVS